MSLRPWIFLKSRTNREIMSWLGGGATVIAAGMWAVFVFLVHHDGKVGGEASAPQVSQSGTGIASGGNTVINAPVNIGVNEQRVGQQFVDAQKPLADKLEKLLALTARDKGVEVAPLRAILVKLGEAGVSDEDIAKRLDQKADELVKLREEIGRLRQGPAELASFAQQAQALIDKGDLDGARKSLAAARAAARKLREQSSRYEADFLVQEARVDHLQLAYRSAAAKYAEAASLVAAVDRQKQWEFMLGQANELYSQGNELGDNAALAEALTVGRGSLLLAPRSERPLDWAMTQNNLGNALWKLGERESGSARLEEAVDAFRDALTERTRERVPLDWAATQNNLGGALATLGDRESGTARLEEAVTAFRDALTERTRERVPLDWAGTQNNLGNVLTTLGDRESGTARLEEAVAAFRDALKERTRERVPLDWATTQNNLGIVLMRLGEREAGTARLEGAVAVFRDALTEYTRERVPLAWAMTQNNLGNALATLGERESGTARLEEAIAAFRDALTEYTRERGPLAWATSTGNQGVVLMQVAERRSDTEMARTAFAQIEAAFTAMRDGGHAPHASFYEAQLPYARALVAKLSEVGKRH